jgi:UDP-glucose 4-epimerase
VASRESSHRESGLARDVLVTGGAGFIGSHLVDALLGDGHRVTVIDDLSSGLERRIHEDAAFHRVDIVDRDALDAVVDEVEPDAIFHLAAQSSVTISVTDPARDCAVNVEGTLNVLQAATRHGAPLVFSSTGGALYGNEAPIPTPEDRIPAPLAPYGASKWAGEAYVKTWAAASAVPHAICRLGNVYGPRQSPHGEAGVVAIFTHHLFERRAPKIYGHGSPTRDYVHVSDVVAALRAASGVAGTFNLATGIETDVMSVWDILLAASGAEVEPALAPLREGELERSCLDPSRARRELGWEAQIPLREGLRESFDALIDEFTRALERRDGEAEVAGSATATSP